MDIRVEDSERLRPYELLANAIVEQAAKDWLWERRCETLYPSEEKRKHMKERRKIERFFRSERFKIYTKLDPEYLLEQLEIYHREKVKKIGRLK